VDALISAPLFEREARREKTVLDMTGAIDGEPPTGFRNRTRETLRRQEPRPRRGRQHHPSTAQPVVSTRQEVFDTIAVEVSKTIHRVAETSFLRVLSAHQRQLVTVLARSD